MHEFYLEEFHQVLKLRIGVCVEGETPCVLGRGRGKVNILKYTQSILHNKVLHSKENYILKAFWT